MVSVGFQTGPPLGVGGGATLVSSARFLNGLSLLRMLVPTTLTVADSTPLVDLYDMEADWGFTGREPFRGFKLHAIVNQIGLP